MTSSPRKDQEDSLQDSWVELNFQTGFGNDLPQPKIQPLTIYDGTMEKLLMEAQRESNQSSARESGASSHRSSFSFLFSPKGPHSPTNDSVPLTIKKDELGLPFEKTTDWIWDWSSRPEPTPPKKWKFQHPKRVRLSMRNTKAMKSHLFSKEFLSILFITNLLSLVIGTGIGIYIGKRIGTLSTIALD